MLEIPPFFEVWGSFWWSVVAWIVLCDRPETPAITPASAEGIFASDCGARSVPSAVR